MKKKKIRKQNRKVKKQMKHAKAGREGGTGQPNRNHVGKKRKVR